MPLVRVLGLALLLACSSRTPLPVSPANSTDTESEALALKFFPDAPARVPAPRLRLLSRVQYEKTVSALLGQPLPIADTLDPEPLVDDYTTDSRHAFIDERRAQQYARAARQVAAQAAAKLLAQPCPPATPDCRNLQLLQFAERAQRAPLPAEDRARLLTAFRETRAEAGEEAALNLALEAVLRSPRFLYRADDERATPVALAYTFTDQPAAGEAASTVRERARQLINSPAGQEVFFRFVTEWLGIVDMAEKEKSQRVYKAWNVRMGRAAMAETRRFVQHVLTKQGGDLRELLTATYSFPPPVLRDLYGLPSAEGDPATPPAEPVRLDPQQRAGIITHPSFLGSHATSTETSLTDRGVFIAARLLCDPPPPPPPDVPPLPQADGVFRTKRQRLEKHATDPVCASCHESFDPLGYALESFDAFGRFRREENGTAIDASGELVITGGGVHKFTDALDMLRRLAVTPEVHQCFIRQAFRYYRGRREVPADNATLRRAFLAFRRSGMDMREALVAFVDEPQLAAAERTP